MANRRVVADTTIFVDYLRATKKERTNQIIEFRDIFIGAICLANNLPVCTSNTNHFNRIDGLELYRI
jgi:predicted nucleic acid-binding protein